MVGISLTTRSCIERMVCDYISVFEKKIDSCISIELVSLGFTTLPKDCTKTVKNCLPPLLFD